MPEPDRDPNLPVVKRTAQYALLAGIIIALLKFGVFWLTNSVAVLSDALESIINITAAGVMLYTIHYSNRPADREHPYGHGKIEFLAVGLEGWLILLAAVVIAFEAIRRLFTAPELNLDTGIWLLAGVGVLDGILAAYVWRAGRRYQNAVLQADGKHLITDVASTAGVVVGLVLVQWTGWQRLDSFVAIVMAALILAASWRLLWQSFHGLMDHADPEDDRAIIDILNDEVRAGQIHGYHKVRHRHTGPFHWVDMHLQVDGDMTVTDGHELASRIEGRIEQRLGRANATAHLEPYDPQRHPPAGPSADHPEP
ncbi:MAG: cation diffusion facilitator family transporter, partial [Phycisphaeraceae bacterium]